LRPCANTRCKRRVFDAKIIPAHGAPLDIVLDAQPLTWPDGARIKLLPSEHSPHQLAQKLTAAQIHQAFAVRELYVLHREVCQAEQRKTRAKKADGSHA
jgi:hypothetical protein